MTKARSPKKKKPPNPRRAWLYARVSTRKASQAQSPDHQLKRLATVATLKGWAIVGRSVDRASSARVSDLVGLARAIEAIQTAKANILMVTDLDRIGGTLRDILDTTKLIDDLGGHLFIESYQIDTTQGGPIGRYFFHTLAAFAELRRTLQNDKITRGIASARARGRRLGRPRLHYPSTKLIARAAELRAATTPPPGWRTVVALLKAEKFRGVPSHPTLRRFVLEGMPKIVGLPKARPVLRLVGSPDIKSSHERNGRAPPAEPAELAAASKNVK
jgi:DNA invertase Pin-like site-specific DNA recombinase